MQDMVPIAPSFDGSLGAFNPAITTNLTKNVLRFALLNQVVIT